ncbi:MAG: helix-turn-helix domain-containing protein [Armatimonadetes bacterium]|nr:helix-turn-helix domain-containing protein [Armatimonadota bacterium]
MPEHHETGRFVRVPHELIDYRDALLSAGRLLPVDWIVYETIRRHENAEGRAYCSQRGVAARTGVSERNVARAVGRLREAGLVAVEPRACYPRRFAYRILPPPPAGFPVLSPESVQCVAVMPPMAPTVPPPVSVPVTPPMANEEDVDRQEDVLEEDEGSSGGAVTPPAGARGVAGQGPAAAARLRSDPKARPGAARDGCASGRQARALRHALAQGYGLPEAEAALRECRRREERGEVKGGTIRSLGAYLVTLLSEGWQPVQAGCAPPRPEWRSWRYGMIVRSRRYPDRRLVVNSVSDTGIIARTPDGQYVTVSAAACAERLEPVPEGG